MNALQSVVLSLALIARQESAEKVAPSPAPDFIDRVVAAEATTRGVPGVALAVVSKGRVVAVRGYGMADLEASRPVTAATPFNIASVTKPFTALVVVRLAARHVLDLDAEARRHAPWLPESLARITVRQLLTHTSGIVRDVRRDNFDDPDVAEYRGRVVASEPAAEPGIRWEYSNTGFTVLGWVAESASKQSLESLFQKEIFEPAGMKHAAYRQPLTADPERARPYQLVDGRPQPIAAITGGFGSGGISMSASDFAAFALALQRGELSTEDDRKQASTPVRLKDGSVAVPGVYSKDDGYGFGWFITSQRGHRKLAHGGGIAGFCASLEHFPEDQLTIAVVANSKVRDDGAAPVATIATLLADHFLGEGVAQKPPVSDADQVKRVVEDYLHGLKFNDVRCFQRSFWPDARLFSVGKSGVVEQLTQSEWYRSFTGNAGKEEEGELEIDNIDLTDDAASVKVTETYATTIYTDYLNLLKLGGEWRIVNKIYTSRARS